ncbi:MAG: BlaI/MecI/CopY family transcriptional regulator [Bryobacteraceae bacterium]
MRIAGAPREIPPPLELACLRVLWQLGEACVRDVLTSMAPERTLAYTTVMTVLDRLARRGAVSRRKAGRSYRYAAVLQQDALRKLAVRELLETYFDGSERELAAFLRANDVSQP